MIKKCTGETPVPPSFFDPEIGIRIYFVLGLIHRKEVENKPTGDGPRAYIAIKHPSDRIKWKEGKNEIEIYTISPDCTIFEDFEFQVDRLIKELETIKKQGKKFFENEEEIRRDYLIKKS